MRVVGVGISLPDRSALGDGLVDVDAGILDGEVQQRGRASKEGGTADLLRRRRTQVLTLGHERRGDMGVGFDASRNHYLARSVDHPARFFGKCPRSPNSDDFVSLDRYLPVAYAPASHDLAAFNNQI